MSKYSFFKALDAVRKSDPNLGKLADDFGSTAHDNYNERIEKIESIIAQLSDNDDKTRAHLQSELERIYEERDDANHSSQNKL